MNKLVIGEIIGHDVFLPGIGSTLFVSEVIDIFCSYDDVKYRVEFLFYITKKDVKYKLAPNRNIGVINDDNINQKNLRTKIKKYPEYFI